MVDGMSPDLLHTRCSLITRLSRLMVSTCFVLLVGFYSSSQAQVQVFIDTERDSFIPHEAMIVKVTLTNLSGRDLFLRNDQHYSWLNFQMQNMHSERYVQKRQKPEQFEPLFLKTGQSTVREVDLSRHFVPEESGTTTLTATVYAQDSQQHFASNRKVFEIVEPLVLWRQVVGIPGGGGQSKFSILSSQIKAHKGLYVRVEDEHTGRVYVTRLVGHHLDFAAPQTHIDRESNLHLLFLAAQQTWLYLVFDPVGEQKHRVVYRNTDTRPSLYRTGEGLISVLGGRADIPRGVPTSPDLAGEEAAVSNISERPEGLPGL